MNTTVKIFNMLLANTSDLNKKGKLKSNLLAVLRSLAIIAIATVAIVLIFARFVTVGLAVNEHFFAVMLMVSQIISIVLCLNNIISTMYYANDNLLLFSMPCTAGELFWAKAILLFLSELKASLMFSVPVFLSYALLAGGTLGFYLLMFPCIVLLTMFCIVVAGFLSVPVVLIRNFFATRNKLKTIVYMSVSLIGLSLYLLVVMSIADKLDFSGQQYEIVSSFNTFIRNMANSSYVFLYMCRGMLLKKASDGINLAVSVVVIALLLVFAIGIIKQCFYRLATISMDKPSASRDFIGKISVTTPFRSLVSKDLRELIRSSNSLTQFFLFTICMPFIVLLYGRLLSSLYVNEVGVSLTVASHLLIMGIFACLSNMSVATSISREGKCFYANLVSPIDYSDITLAKLFLPAIFTTISIAVSSIGACLFTEIATIDVVVIGCLTVIISLVHLVAGFTSDLKKPVLDWLDEVEIAQKSRSGLHSMVLALVMPLLFFAVYVAFIIFAVSSWVVYLTLFVLALIALAVVTVHLAINGRRYYQRMGG